MLTTQGLTGAIHSFQQTEEQSEVDKSVTLLFSSVNKISDRRTWHTTRSTKRQCTSASLDTSTQWQEYFSIHAVLDLAGSTSMPAKAPHRYVERESTHGQTTSRGRVCARTETPSPIKYQPKETKWSAEKPRILTRTLLVCHSSTNLCQLSGGSTSEAYHARE